MRYFIRCSFDGTNFHGWQIQENAHSVQAELNKALTILLREEIKTTGCGRTDTGVHASKFFVHFDVTEPINSTEDLLYQLNALLPNAIAIQGLFSVSNDDHARFDATSRTYQYVIYNHKNPFLKNYAFYYPNDLDVKKMNSIAKFLFEFQDFSCFSKTHTQTFTNNCKIMKAEWFYENNRLIFEIKADRFLRNMVRAIVGTLLKAGLNRIDEKEFREILESKQRSEAGASVPAHGLFLTDVEYPFQTK